MSDRLPAEAFRYLGESLFGKEHWQPKMALELKVDEPTIKQWASEGPPASLSEKLSHIAAYRRCQISAPLTMPGMPDADLKPWERADRLLKEYEGLNQDPTMVYNGKDNKANVTRVIAELLHYCSYQNSRVGLGAIGYLPIPDILRDAEALYRSEPRMLDPDFKNAPDIPYSTKDLIPFVLTDDPAKMAEFQKRFGVSQDQAVDEFIETTCWAEDLPKYVGKKGTPQQRLQALRRVLRTAGEK